MRQREGSICAPCKTRVRLPRATSGCFLERRHRKVISTVPRLDRMRGRLASDRDLDLVGRGKGVRRRVGTVAMSGTRRPGLDGSGESRCRRRGWPRSMALLRGVGESAGASRTGDTALSVGLSSRPTIGERRPQRASGGPAARRDTRPRHRGGGPHRDRAGPGSRGPGPSAARRLGRFAGAGGTACRRRARRARAGRRLAGRPTRRSSDDYKPRPRQ